MFPSTWMLFTITLVSLTFFVINLKDYTGSVSCFLNLMKIEPFKDQALLILYLQV